jgi:hypothetical protein
MKRIDAVIVSVDYADFLAATLPLNKPHFNRTLVVTAEHDTATRRLCRHLNVECLVTDVMTRDGQKFNKGAGINLGLETLDFPDWCVHLDADIALPPRFREMLQRKALNEQVLYGADRMMCPSYEAWAEFQAAPVVQHEHGRTSPAPFPLGYRVVRTKTDFGYVPIGYLQLFNRNSGYLGSPLYPAAHDGADKSDLEFAIRWPASHRQLLPEVFVYHLQSEGDAPNGANWDGRTTPTFGPVPNIKETV